MKKILLVITVFLALGFEQVLAQSVFYGISAGITSVTGPEAFTSDISSGGSGFSNEDHVGILAKFHFPINPITPVISFNYHRLRGSSGNTETSQNVYSIGMNLQFTLKAGKVSPYISLDGSYNFFGKFNIDNPPASYSTNTSQSSASSLSSKNRFGGGFGFGTDLNLISDIDIDLSIRYSIMNLLGAESSEDNINFLTITAAILF